jgi:adenylyl-sulfate kinase
MPSKKHLHQNNYVVNKRKRSSAKAQRPICIWLTGLSAAGKSTIANMLEHRLHVNRFHTYLLDGDSIRGGLNQDLGFSANDRHENIRRTAEVARLMVDAGLIVIVSFISPFRSDRAFARSLFEVQEFYEVFVDASIEECIYRDPKGLYEKAISGQLKEFTGVTSTYEPPEHPDVHLNSQEQSPEACVEKLFKFIFQRVKC